MEVENYRKALTEVNEIIMYSEKEIVGKIPKKFFDYINENMDNTYLVNIDFYSENWEDTILDETKAILAMIYRDYIVSKEEREILIKREREEEEERERKLKEQYQIDNLFKKNETNNSNNSKTDEHQLIVIKDLKWYQKIYQKILKIFGIRKQ